MFAACCPCHLVQTLSNLQVESAISVQKLKPTIDAIKRQYGEDKDKVQRETSALYEKAGVNPLAGRSQLKFRSHSHKPLWSKAICRQVQVGRHGNKGRKDTVIKLLLRMCTDTCNYSGLLGSVPYAEQCGQ